MYVIIDELERHERFCRTHVNLKIVLLKAISWVVLAIDSLGRVLLVATLCC